MDVLHAAWAAVGVVLCGGLWYSVLRRTRRSRTAAAVVVCAAGVLAAVVGAASQIASQASAQAPEGQGFNLNASDLRFILKQIKIAEHHATTETGPGEPLVGPGEFQIANPLLPYGLRTVDGSENNLQPDQSTFGAADQKFPRFATPFFRTAEDGAAFGSPGQTSYSSVNRNVVDSQPRVISNLIVDQTSANPAAVRAAGVPHRTFLGEPSTPCTTEPDPATNTPGSPEGCTPEHQTLFIPNITTDVGLSPPFNAWFTFFGQFFDHGVDFTEKAGGAVFVPLKPDDPLIAGPDHVLGNDDDLPANKRFMVITRTKNLPGPDHVLGTDDDEHEATNTDTPWVDQSQTYTSHPSHQVFLRRYVANAAGKPVSTGKLLEGADGGMATWAATKTQARNLLGIDLTDADALNVPLLATDQYGRFLRGPDGFPQLVTAGGMVEGNPAAPVSTSNARRTDHAFLDDIAHHAVPAPGLNPDADSSITPATSEQPAGTYDDEMLDRHFIAGDGRVNENIGLTAVHQIFHSEHNRLVDYIEGLITAQNIDVAEWQLAPGVWNGERIFQAARFVTEMEYQHLVFEEFARKIAPLIDPFQPFAQPQTDLNPAIKAEFAHAVYRFGHSMLTDTVAASEPGPSGTTIHHDRPLLDVFLNPPAYNQGANGPLTPRQAAGAIIMGNTDQAGNEIDEFVTETLRNNLLGLPLDLPTINMTRARDAGVPSLNNFRKDMFKKTNDGALHPYSNWVDFSLSLKHPYSVINFMAAYGKHPTIADATTAAAKRAAAKAIFDGGPDAPADTDDFINSTGPWADDSDGHSITGLDDVDLWVGGLAEKQNLFGGLLGSTFNFVFENVLTDLQQGDRLYYLARTPGMNLRTQLEGNSFAELIQRNTNARALKADVFSTADCQFELANLQGSGNTVADDPQSGCDESQVLIRMADGTIRYREQNSVDPPGLNAQSTFNGTAGADKVQGGVDNDTFWGNEGADRIEGNDGADVALGGIGNDIITDIAGDDVLKGGAGNDALDGGPGLDLLMGGAGNDFMDGGLNINEHLGDDGDDMIILGNGEDAAIGDSGDDWEEGGNGPDLLIGDSSAPFFDDINAPGDDILIGDGGDDDYDAEGGEDILAAGPGVEKSAGADGWDWFAHYLDPQPANTDLDLLLVLLPAPVVGTRDKFNSVEGLSGGRFDDVLRGRSNAILPGTGNLDARQINLIEGLQQVVGAGVTSFSDDNDIILGGAGSDVIEGRGSDDIIEGDKWLRFQLRAPDPATASTTDFKLVDSLTALRADVFAGRIDPGDIHAVRTIETAPAGSDIDTAVYSGPRANYTITPGFNSTEMTITDTTGTDGTDTVRGIEKLQFSDVTVSIVPSGTVSPTALAFPNTTTGASSPQRTVTITNGGQQPLAITGVSFAGANPADFIRTAATPGTCTDTTTLATNASCTVNVQFRPTTTGARSAILRFTDNDNGTPGSFQDVALSGTGVAPAPVVNATPNPLAFGSRTTNTTSPASTVTVSNTGNAPLNFTAIGFTGTNASDFARSGGTCAVGTPVAAGSSCTIGVTFRPGAAGPRSGNLTLTDNAAPGTQNVSLTGTGVAPAPVATRTPTSLTFATTAVNTTSASQNVTLSNTGNAPLTIASITFAGTNPGDFLRTGGSCPTAANGQLAAGASCTVAVAFRPAATGARSGILRFTDDSGNVSSTQDVTLTGTGGTATISVSPTSLNFGNNSIALGGLLPPTRTVTVTAGGNAPLIFSGVTVTGPNASNFTITSNSCTGSRNPGQTCSVTVRFRASSPAGNKTASLRIASNAATSPTLITMVGNATL